MALLLSQPLLIGMATQRFDDAAAVLGIEAGIPRRLDRRFLLSCTYTQIGRRLAGGGEAGQGAKGLAERDQRQPYPRTAAQLRFDGGKLATCLLLERCNRMGQQQVILARPSGCMPMAQGRIAEVIEFVCLLQRRFQQCGIMKAAQCRQAGDGGADFMSDAAVEWSQVGNLGLHLT